MTEDRATAGGERPEEAPFESAPLQPGEGADLLSIGLLVFFVAILVVVAALLALPVVLG
jgi:hypothetical protein